MEYKTLWQVVVERQKRQASVFQAGHNRQVNSWAALAVDPDLGPDRVPPARHGGGYIIQIVGLNAGPTSFNSSLFVRSAKQRAWSW
jgi:hypothetical protein